MLKFLFTLIFALVVVSQAAPVEKRGKVQCKAVGEPGVLTGWYSNGTLVTGFQVAAQSNSSGNFDVTMKKNADSKFQLYECQAPSDKFNTSSDKAYFGQLRSMDVTDFCLTSGNALVPDGGQSDDPAMPKFKYDPDEHGELTLRPCSAVDDFVMRLQWFSLKKSSSCAPSLLYEAYKTDETLKNIYGEKWMASFYYPGKEPMPLLSRLASASKKCDA